LVITNDIVILAKGTNTPLPTNTSIPLPTSIIGLNMPLIDPRKQFKHTTPYLERFIGEDELIYSRAKDFNTIVNRRKDFNTIIKILIPFDRLNDFIDIFSLIRPFTSA
jgi:hypothetical protein